MGNAAALWEIVLVDPREYDWQMGDLAAQDLYPDERGFQPPPAPRTGTGEEYAGLGGDPTALATTLKNWWTNQPSWIEKAKAENQKTLEAYNLGGIGEVARQTAYSVPAAEDLVGAFGVGNVKGVGKALPKALPVSEEQFNAMSSRGRMRAAGAPDELKPSKANLVKANSPVDYGRLYGYSEDDIARFYRERRAGHPMAYDEYIRDLQNSGFKPITPKDEPLTGFVPGSVLTPEGRAALPKNWRDLPGENAPFPQYAEQYPPVGPPTMVPKDNPKFKGETYPEKTLTPEGEEFVKARNKIMSDMKKSGYEPYFDPKQRYYADPSKYPAANVDTLTVTPKKAETIADYEKVINTPETRRLLREAYDRGEKLGNADHWYAMGQLESEYIKELGSKAGRKAFLEEFAVPMAATTSGNKPINNLLMAHYFEVLRKRGEPIPEGHQFPPPVGGRRANVNVRDYESVMESGGYSALGAAQPKMHNFSRSFIGDLSRAVMDEQMAGGSLAHAKDKAFVDKARTTGFGLLEKQLHTEAARKGVQPGNFQDVAWAGFKNEAGKPMIAEVNDAIERTHRLTGMPRSEIVRRGLIQKEIPLYGAGGVAIMGGLAAQDEYR
jgi:hypothetical protein